MLISVWVIPRSARNTLEWEELADQRASGTAGGIRARLMAAPVDGAANKALIALLSRQLAVPARTITIVRGATSRHKVIDIAGLESAEVRLRLQGS